MSNAEIYNHIALLGIILAIAFTVWLHRQTRKVEQEMERLVSKRARSRRPLHTRRLR